LPDGKERRGPVHAPRRDAERGAEGVPGEALRLRRCAGRRPPPQRRGGPGGL
ncbi:MAG: hypothetical protein AVDCRST_MAG05-3066, partial [uncultured Rubrobacteraceae bacterium]